MERLDVTDAQLLQAIEVLTRNVGKRMEQHGRGSFVSAHESLGVITEEYQELVTAVKSNDPMDIAQELMDVAVGAIFGAASMIAIAEEIQRLRDELSPEEQRTQH